MICSKVIAACGLRRRSAETVLAAGSGCHTARHGLPSFAPKGDGQRRRRLCPLQQQVKHPAAAHVLARLPKVSEQRGAYASLLFPRVTRDRQILPSRSSGVLAFLRRGLYNHESWEGISP
jgi:hypothetical protein